MNDINMIKLSSQLLFIIPLTLGIGIAVMAFQTAINTQLKTYLHSPIQAAFSFWLGRLFLRLWFIFQSAKPSLSELYTFRGSCGWVGYLGFMQLVQAFILHLKPGF